MRGGRAPKNNERREMIWPSREIFCAAVRRGMCGAMAGGRRAAGAAGAQTGCSCARGPACARAGGGEGCGKLVRNFGAVLRRASILLAGCWPAAARAAWPGPAGGGGPGPWRARWAAACAPRPAAGRAGRGILRCLGCQPSKFFMIESRQSFLRNCSLFLLLLLLRWFGPQQAFANSLNLTMNQISNWFVNARRRILNPRRVKNHGAAPVVSNPNKVPGARAAAGPGAPPVAPLALAPPVPGLTPAQQQQQLMLMSRLVHPQQLVYSQPTAQYPFPFPQVRKKNGRKQKQQTPTFFLFLLIPSSSISLHSSFLFCQSGHDSDAVGPVRAVSVLCAAGADGVGGPVGVIS